MLNTKLSCVFWWTIKWLSNFFISRFFKYAVSVSVGEYKPSRRLSRNAQISDTFSGFIKLQSAMVCLKILLILLHYLLQKNRQQAHQWDRWIRRMYILQCERIGAFLLLLDWLWVLALFEIHHDPDQPGPLSYFTFQFWGNWWWG